MMGVAIIALAALTVVQPVSAWGTGEWIDARATFYGRDAWPLHIGSCGFGFVCPTSWSGELKHGYDLVALSDQNPLFTGQQGSSCGQCLEVKCRAATIKDGFGDSFDRTQQCLNDLSVKVKVADTCQCEYAANAQSNKRWCCGDYPHLDMSQWALEKIAQDPDKWGVFGISYRTIDCKAAIADEAPNPSSIPADPHTGQRKSGEPCAGGGGEGSSNSAGSSSGGSVSTESSSKTRAVAAPEPTPSPTPDPTFAPKPKPAPRPDPTPAPTPNPTPRRTPSPTPEPTPEPTPNPTPESTAASAQRQASSRRSGTPRPTAQPTAQPTPKLSAEPSTPKPSPKPSAQPSPKPSAQPSPKPSAQPSPKPSAQPSPKPSARLSPRPSAAAQQRSAAQPSPKPSARLSPRPSAAAQRQQRSAAQPSPKPSPKSSAKPSPKPSRQTVSVNTQSASRKRAADSGSGGSSSGGGSSSSGGGSSGTGSSGSDRIPVSQVPKVTCSERKHSPKFYVRQQVYIDGRRTSPNPPGYYPRIFAYFEQFDDNMMPLEQLDSIKPLDGRTPGVPLDCNELPDDPQPQRKKGSKEWTHSPKYWTRRDIYMKARDTAPNPRGYYSRIVQYFAQFGPNMKPLDDSKPVEPLVR